MPSPLFSDAYEVFLRPARTRPAVWRIVLGLGLIFGIYIGLNLAAFGVLVLFRGFDVAANQVTLLSQPETPGTSLALLATFVPMALAPLIAVVVLHRRRPGTLFGPAKRTARDFGCAAALLFGLQALVIGITGSANGSLPNMPLGLWWLLLPVTLAAVAVQTLSEELVFRGYLQQQLAARFAMRAIWMGVPSLLFASLHFSPGTLGHNAYFAVFAALAFGLAAADLTARTGSIGAAWGVHFANNCLAIAVLGTKGTISGLALRITPEAVQDLPVFTLTSLLDLLPPLLAWLVLRFLLVAK